MSDRGSVWREKRHWQAMYFRLLSSSAPGDIVLASTILDGLKAGVPQTTPYGENQVAIELTRQQFVRLLNIEG